MDDYDDRQRRLCCVLVGLPARGKTYTGRKIARYLAWQGVSCRVFNVGCYRRRMCGAELPHHFFDPDNREAEEQRRGAAMACLEDMVRWMQEECGTGCRVAVYDATNSTRERRRLISQRCSAAGIDLLFIESVCTDQTVIVENIRQVKQDSPDYASRVGDPEAIVADFMARIEHYARAYEPLELDYSGHAGMAGMAGLTGLEQDYEHAPPFASIQLIDLGRQYVIRHVEGYWEARIAYLLMNMHVRPRRILLCRHGESEFNVVGRIGGDASLSPRGRQFAEVLPAVVQDIVGDEQLTVWTSSFRRTKQTAAHLRHPQVELKALDEIDAGVCEGLTYDEIAARYPQDFSARDRAKFHYRYRGGESYADLINRLEPVIMDLERAQHTVLVIGHQAVLRALIAYYREAALEELPYQRVPLHTVIELVPTAYGCRVREHPVGVDCVDTHRPKPPVNQ